MNINKTIIIGRITQNLELKAMPNGNNVLSFSVATNYVYKNKDDNKIEETEFHNIVSFGKQAEIISKYFVKGQEIYLEGRLKTQSWEDKESGKKMYRTEIILEKFDFGAKPLNQNQQNIKENNDEKIEKTEIEYPEDDINPEDIPF